jgi:hypothetical protein
LIRHGECEAQNSVYQHEHPVFLSPGAPAEIGVFVPHTDNEPFGEAVMHRVPPQPVPGKLRALLLKSIKNWDIVSTK